MCAWDLSSKQAPARRASLTPAAATGAAAGDAAGGAAGSSSQPPKHATARHPFLTAASFGRTHPGGFKPSDARNQDTFFELRMDEHNAGQ